MYKLIYHPLVKEDLKQLNNSIRIEVFKKIEKIKQSPELGKPLGNKNGMNLTGLLKVYVAKKSIRIVYEVIDDVLVIKVIAIGKRENMLVYKQAEERKDS